MMIEDFYKKNNKLLLVVGVLIIFIILMLLAYNSSQNKNLKSIDDKDCGCNRNNNNYRNGNNKYQLQEQIYQMESQQNTMMNPFQYSSFQSNMNRQPTNEVLPDQVAIINNGNVNQPLPIVNLPQGSYIQNLPIFSNLSGPVMTNIRNQPITATKLRNNIVLNSDDVINSVSNTQQNQRRYLNTLIAVNNKQSKKLSKNKKIKNFDLNDKKISKKRK